MINFELRGFETEDLNFIYSSWLKSHRDSQFAKNVPSDLYYHYQKDLIDRILERSQVLVAVNPDLPSQIFGWSVGEQRGNIHILHYVYVKYPYRKLGIAKALAGPFVHANGGRPTLCTSRTWKGRQSPFEGRLIYNPYLLMELG